MPLHEFKCQQCGKSFEELVFSGTDKVTCPECGSENVTKLVSAFASTGGNKTSAGASCGSRGRFT